MAVSLVKSAPERKLIALIGVNGEGLFVRHPINGGSIYILHNGAVDLEPSSLETLAAESSGRLPVYRGEEVLIKFV